MRRKTQMQADGKCAADGPAAIALDRRHSVARKGPTVTENVEERSGADGPGAAAAERRLALVVAAVADRRQADDQPAAEVTDACVDHRPVLLPRDAHFDERSGGGEMKGRRRKRRMLFKKKWLHIPFQGYTAPRERWSTSVILIKPFESEIIVTFATGTAAGGENRAASWNQRGEWGRGTK